MIGTSLAHYRITAALGAGGMGEVWRATDTRLGREVALKVLPESFADDPERHARFEREAKTLASLNHPNIATLYGLEHLEVSDPAAGAVGAELVSARSSARSAAPADGVPGTAPAAPVGLHVLVMELVEGEGLDELVARGPVPVDDAIRIALQIAEGLEAAHEAGIVHRDLKPANVRIRPDGAVKVLDFGLAKAWETEKGDSSLSLSPTMTKHATAAGVILGTAAYMSPEQARGKPVDRRADIWAFGVVLWEMLTGRKLFEGETVTDVLAAVLTREPDLTALPGGTPPALRRLLGRCLERSPKNRLRDIGEARIVLAETLAGNAVAEGQAEPSPPAPPRSSRLTAAWITTVAIAAVAFVGVFVVGRRAPPPEPRRLILQLPSEHRLITDGNSLLAFDPKGESLVMTGEIDGRQLLLRRTLTEDRIEPIDGTEDGQAAFFSPDGRWIGYVARGQLMKVAAEGGTPFRLGDCQGAGGAAWLPDGTLVFAPIYSDGLFRVSVEGGEPERLTSPDRDSGELGHWWPEPLPDAGQIVFTAFRTPVDRSRIGVLDLDTREVRWVLEGGFFGRYAASGHLLYARGQRLFAVPFDPETATVTGTAVDLVDDLRVSQTGGFAMFAASTRGDLAYVTESLGNPAGELMWLDRGGESHPAATQRERFLSVSLSPDNRRAAVTVQGESRDLWTYSLDRGTLSRLTSSSGTEFDPTWSSDGRELYYVVDRPPFQLHRIPLGSPDAGRPIWDETSEVDATGIAVSPDGRWLAFVLSEAETGRNLYSRPLDGSEPARPFRTSRAEEWYPTFSPDGRWLAYQSGETGRSEIYVEAFPGPGERYQITADGGVQPVWTRASGEIFYRHGDEFRVVATRLSEGRLELDEPRTLFSYPIAPAAAVDARTYDVTADGERVLTVSIPEADRPRRVEFVTDLVPALSRRAPSRR